MEKLLFWSFFLLSSYSNGFFIGSKDIKKFLSYLPKSLDIGGSQEANFRPKIRPHFHHHHHRPVSHHHSPHHHSYETDTKPEYNEDYEEDYDIYHERNDNFTEKNEVDKADRNDKELNKNTQAKRKTLYHKKHDPAKCTHPHHDHKIHKHQKSKPQQDQQQTNEENEYPAPQYFGSYNNEEDEDYYESTDPSYYYYPPNKFYNRKSENYANYPRGNLAAILPKHPLNYKKDYVTGVLVTIPKINNNAHAEQYFNQAKYNNPFSDSFAKDSEEYESQTELISKPFSFLDNFT